MDLTGVDIDWVREKLTHYVARTAAVGASAGGYVTARTRPECGRPEAVVLTETVRPILNKLYPEWQSENPQSKNDEFRAERDACRRLLARLATQDEVAIHLGGIDESPRLAASALHPLIWAAAQAQWSTGHRHEAVLAAAKTVNSHLQNRVGRRDISEMDLVKQAFSDSAPELGKARLRFDSITDEQTRSSMRRGVMNFGSGCFGAIRNPVGHLQNDELELSEQTALERLAALSLLTRWIDEANLVTTD